MPDFFGQKKSRDRGDPGSQELDSMTAIVGLFQIPVALTRTIGNQTIRTLVEGLEDHVSTGGGLDGPQAERLQDAIDTPA